MPTKEVAAVSASDPRHGRPGRSRRDNGLVAAEYAAAGDVDPRVGEHLLDVLALDGIAAYLRPSTDLHPITRQTSLPSRPTDRLYVDRAHLSAARAYLNELAAEAGSDDAPGPTRVARPSTETAGRAAETDLDAEWAAIVAGYNAEVGDPRRSWPAAEDVEEGSPVAGDRRADHDRPPTRATGGGGTAGTDEPSLLEGLDTFGADLPDEDEEGYTPPAPPPIPRPSTPTVLGVAGMIGGLLLFLRPDVAPLAEGTAMVVGFLAIVAGFATLVWRLRPGDDEDDIDPDDGARV